MIGEKLKWFPGLKIFEVKRKGVCQISSLRIFCEVEELENILMKRLSANSMEYFSWSWYSTKGAASAMKNVQ